MKVFAQLLIPVLAASAVAAPLNNQIVMSSRLPVANVVPEPEPSSADSPDALATPPTIGEDSPPVLDDAQAAAVEPSKAVEDDWPGHAEEHWRDQAEAGEEEDQRDEEKADDDDNWDPWPLFTCFCAAGSICCHVPEGVSCDFGSCGI